MPYKQKLKNPAAVNPRKKIVYKINNWSEYNKSLKRRGELSLYFPKGDLKNQFVNDTPYVQGVSGREATYSNVYIQVIFTLYRLLGFGIRQITGYFEDLWRTKGLDIPVPSFGHLSDLFAAIPLKVKQFCNELAKRIKNGAAISLILDSTGLRFGKASHWYQTKFKKPCENKPWRKFHFSMDFEMNMHEVEITECDVADIDVMDDLIPQDESIKIDNLLGDGAYYSKEGVEDLHLKGIVPVIPPPSNSVVHGQADTTWHDKIVEYIKEKGTVYAFHKKYGYGKRSLVEAQISRIKRCIGTSLKTQRDNSQKNEGIIICNLINQWNSFGRCQSVKMS